MWDCFFCNLRCSVHREVHFEIDTILSYHIDENVYKTENEHRVVKKVDEYDDGVYKTLGKLNTSCAAKAITLSSFK